MLNSRSYNSQGNKKNLFLKFIYFLNFYCYSIIVVCLFSPSLHTTPAKPTSFRCFHPPPWFCPCGLYSSSWKPFSPLSLPLSPLAIVRLFLTSMTLVISCLLFSPVDYVPVKGEIIWYFSLTAWLISLSIMLFSSIHAVAKGISPFIHNGIYFLFLCLLFICVFHGHPHSHSPSSLTLTMFPRWSQGIEYHFSLCSCGMA